MTRSILQINVNLTEEDQEYFEACSRIRNIGKATFFRRLLETIARDTMVQNILDDDAKPSRGPGDYRYTRWRRPSDEVRFRRPRK